MEDYRFDISVAPPEDEAIALFSSGGFGLVILDYHPTHGNGVNCLRRIREIDRRVPVIAISGAATDEIAAELIAAGADDYLAKQILDAKILQQSVRNVLIRAQAFRSRFAALGK